MDDTAIITDGDNGAERSSEGGEGVDYMQIFIFLQPYFSAISSRLNNLFLSECVD